MANGWHNDSPKSLEKQAEEVLERARELEKETGHKMRIVATRKSGRYNKANETLMAIHMPHELKRMIKLAAEYDRRSMKSYVLKAIEDKLEADGHHIEHHRILANRAAHLSTDQWSPPGLEDDV